MPGPVTVNARPIVVSGEGRANAKFERELIGVRKAEVFGMITQRFEEMKTELGSMGTLKLDPQTNSMTLNALGGEAVLTASESTSGDDVVGKLTIVVTKYPLLGGSKLNAKLRKILDRAPTYIERTRKESGWTPTQA